MSSSLSLALNFRVADNPKTGSITHKKDVSDGLTMKRSHGIRKLTAIGVAFLGYRLWTVCAFVYQTLCPVEFRLGRTLKTKMSLAD